MKKQGNRSVSVWKLVANVALNLFKEAELRGCLVILIFKREVDEELLQLHSFKVKEEMDILDNYRQNPSPMKMNGKAPTNVHRT